MTKTEAVNKLLSVARAEIGYREGANNYTKYSADPNITKLYGWTPQNQPWCCVFVNWCFMTAFGCDIGSQLTYGGTAACANSASLFKRNGAFFTTPEVGDQAFYYSGGGINHTGIVSEVSGSTFKAIEGNYSDKVSVVSHNVMGSDVAGFGRPDWKLVEGQSSTSQTEKPKETGTSQGSLSESSSKDQVNHTWKPHTLQMSNAYSSDCVVLQALLNAHHFACGSADGFYGPKTQAAVNAAQRYYSLTIDGVCGPKTWEKLLKVG